MRQAQLVRYWKRRGLSTHDAIYAALRDFKKDALGMPFLEDAPADVELDEQATEAEINRLENLVLGKRGHANRAKKRRKGDRER